MDYFAAATALTKAANAGTDISQLAPIPYWEHLFPAAAGSFGFGIGPGGLSCSPGNLSFTGTTTATQAMYDMYSCFSGNETTGLFVADLACLPAFVQLACHRAPGQPLNLFLNHDS